MKLFKITYEGPFGGPTNIGYEYGEDERDAMRSFKRNDPDVFIIYRCSVATTAELLDASRRGYRLVQM
jgi:hypothetical protein